MKLKTINEEVLYIPDEQVCTVGREEIKLLKLKAGQTAGLRCRICTHNGPEASLHEMMITLKKESYIRPHRHLGKVESFHLIDGTVDIVFFDEAGRIVKVCRMGNYQSGDSFYYRIEEPLYHTLLIRSDFLVFHETTNGPFLAEDTEFPAWAPEADDSKGAESFRTQLQHRVERHLAQGGFQ